MKKNLLDTVKAKLQQQSDRAGLEAVAAGSGVPYHTLLKIAKGETTDPRVSTVQSLLRYFEGRAA
jgi:predicted transcriptional regulator